MQNAPPTLHHHHGVKHINQLYQLLKVLHPTWTDINASYFSLQVLVAQPQQVLKLPTRIRSLTIFQHIQHGCEAKTN